MYWVAVRRGIDPLALFLDRSVIDVTTVNPDKDCYTVLAILPDVGNPRVDVGVALSIRLYLYMVKFGPLYEDEILLLLSATKWLQPVIYAVKPLSSKPTGYEVLVGFEHGFTATKLYLNTVRLMFDMVADGNTALYTVHADIPPEKAALEIMEYTIEKQRLPRYIRRVWW